MNFSIVEAVILRQYDAMRRNLVNLVELTHVVDLLDGYASSSIVDRALGSAGLDRAMLTGATGFIPYAVEAVLIEAVARVINDRHLGARLGRDFNYAVYGAYSQFVLGAPDLASALDRGRRALLFTHPGSEIKLRETDTHLVVGRASKGLSVVGHRHLDEGALFVIGHVVRHFAGPDWRPDWVEIPNASANETEELARLVDAPVRIGAQMPAIAIHRTNLSILNPGPPAPQRTITLKELGSLMDVQPSISMQDTVLQMLEITFATGPISEDAAAKLLAIGSRTLQRALKAEGTSFRKLRLRFIEERAVSLVSETSAPIEEISKSLGYTEPRSFRRAFKGWTGFSPTEFRAARKKG